MRRVTYTNAQGNSIVFGPAPSDYLIESIEGIDGANNSIYTQKGPGQDGETFLQTLFAPREIVVNAAILAPQDLSAIYTHRRTIANILNPKLGVGVFTLEYDGSSKKIQAIVQDGVNFPNKDWRSPYQKFSVTFFCPNPVWCDTTAESTTIGLVEAGFHFPLEFVSGGIEFSTRTDAKERTATNNGDVDAAVTLIFYGPATNPTIINNTTGEYIHVFITLDDGESMEIKTAYGEKTITLNRGGTLSNGMQYLDLQSTFWKLIPGDNELTFYDDTDSTLPRCDVGWSNCYISI